MTSLNFPSQLSTAVIDQWPATAPATLLTNIQFIIDGSFASLFTMLQTKFGIIMCNLPILINSIKSNFLAVNEAIKAAIIQTLKVILNEFVAENSPSMIPDTMLQYIRTKFFALQSTLGASFNSIYFPLIAAANSTDTDGVYSGLVNATDAIIQLYNVSTTIWFLLWYKSYKLLYFFFAFRTS